MEDFFMWCSIINGSILVLMFLMCAFAGDFIYRIHSKLFPIPKETFNTIIYCFLGIYKLFFMFFNLVPFLAFAIIE